MFPLDAREGRIEIKGFIHFWHMKVCQWKYNFYVALIFGDFWRLNLELLLHVADRTYEYNEVKDKGNPQKCWKCTQGISLKDVVLTLNLLAGVFFLPLFPPYAARQEQFRNSECQLESLLVLLGAASRILRNVLVPDCSRVSQIILRNIFCQMCSDMKGYSHTWVLRRQRIWKGKESPDLGTLLQPRYFSIWQE